MGVTSSNAVPASGRVAAAVGGLPTDWTEQAIGQFCTVKTGPFGTLLKASEYSEIDGVPVISVGEVREGYFRLTEHTPLVPESVQRRLPQYLLKAGDVVFGRKGAVDRSALVRQPQAGWFLGSDGIAVRPFGEHCPEYVAAQFQSFRVRQWLASNSTGTTMASMNQGVLSRVAIPFPPTIAEERSIAEVLNDADALIDSLEQLLTKKRHIKQGAMQELLTGKRRLPGFEGAWRKATVRDLELSGALTLSRGKVISKKSIADKPGLYPIYSSSIHNNGLFGCYGDFMFDEELITWSVDGGGNFFYRPKHKFSVTNVCGYMRVRAPLNCRFIAFQLEQQHSSKMFDYQTKAHPSVVRAEYLIALPEEREQVVIAQILSDMDTEVTALESRLTKARALKQAMAQALLTGRIRLVEPTA